MGDKSRRTELIRDFTIFDDAYMQAFFNNDIESTEFVLKIILKMPTLKVETVSIQQRLLNSQGHEGIVDVLATDEEGKIYNIEIQNDMFAAPPRRGRYYSSLIDTNFLEEGKPYETLPETYVIFITRGDYFKLKESIYEIEMTVKNHPDIEPNYGVHLLYVNGDYRGTDDIGNLMKDFCCSNPDDMCYNEIKEKARRIKDIGEGYDMRLQHSKLTQEFLDEDRKEVVEELIRLDPNVSLEYLANGTNLPLEVVEEIAESVKNEK